MPAVRSVSMSVYMRVGSRHETADTVGVAHFIEHLLFKGSHDWSTALAIANEIEGRGGYMNASTSRELTVYWLQVGAGFWRNGVALLADMLQRPLFAAEEIEKERGVILDEIRMYHDVPEDWVSQLCSEAMWCDHPLGRDIAGTIDSVSDISPARIREFHVRSYRPGSTVMVMAGAIDSQEVLAAVRSAFGPWSGNGTPPEMVPAPAQGPVARCRIEVRPTEQAHLQMAAPGLSRSSPQRFTLDVLTTILGDGMISRLWQRLREEMGVAYNIGSYRGMYADAGVVGVYGGCDASRLFATLDETMAIWRDMQTTPVSAAELRRAQEYLRGRLELSSESSGAVASWWGRQFATGMAPMTLNEVLQRIDVVTAADIMHLARQVWRPEHMALAYVGPLASPQVLEQWWQAARSQGVS